MNWFGTVVQEIFGLFVDDGSFALAILAWLVVCGLTFSHFHLASRWSGLILFVGLSLILVESATRSTRRCRKSTQR